MLAFVGLTIVQIFLKSKWTNFQERIFYVDSGVFVMCELTLKKDFKKKTLVCRCCILVIHACRFIARFYQEVDKEDYLHPSLDTYVLVKRTALMNFIPSRILQDEKLSGRTTYVTILKRRTDMDDVHDPSPLLSALHLTSFFKTFMLSLFFLIENLSMTS